MLEIFVIQKIINKPCYDHIKQHLEVIWGHESSYVHKNMN